MTLTSFAPDIAARARAGAAFTYHVVRPAAPDGGALVLLHGTGGDEHDLIPLAERLAPAATLVGVRGRSAEEGALRWFRRRSATEFDQEHIRSEAAAFVQFVADLTAGEGLDPARITFVGYSNGANLLGAVMLLFPGVVRRAILLRGIAVQDEMPAADLTGVDVLLLSGRADPYGRLAPPLVAALKAGGARLTVIEQNAGHGLTAADLAAAADWLLA